MENCKETNDLFFNMTELDLQNTQKIVKEALHGADDGAPGGATALRARLTRKPADLPLRPASDRQPARLGSILQDAFSL